MKTKVQVQFNETTVVTTDIEKAVKEVLKADGVKINTIDTLELYYQPAVNAVYYVANLKDGTVVKNDKALAL